MTIRNRHNGHELELDGRGLYYDRESGHHFTADGSDLGVWPIDPDDPDQSPDAPPPPPPLIPPGTTPDEVREAIRLVRLMKGA